MSTRGGAVVRACTAATLSVALAASLAPGATASSGPSADGDGAAAPPAVRTVDPARLKRGPDAAFPFLRDGAIHHGARRVPVRVRHEEGRQMLLGRSGNDWIVSSWTGKGKATDVIRTHRIRRGKAPVTVPRTLIRGSGSGVQLARGGAQILLTRGHRGGNEHWVRRTSDGSLVDTAWTGPSVYTQPFDAADGRVLLHRQDTDGTKYAADWTPGATDRRVGPGLNAGFLRQDVVFVGPAPEMPGPHAYGPTSISSPGTPAWSARFTALSVSPDGKRVIGTGPRLVKGRAVLQVRRMTDGTVLQQFSYGRVVPKGSRALWSPESADQTARFEDSSRFVFELAQGRRAWLVRCSTAGRCARATGPGGAVSSAYERILW